MKVRAVAVANERSNAIGSVELECTPPGLVVVYLGVGAFSQGYAPGALTVGTRVIVPWAAVQEARVEGAQLYLALDPGATPHNRLTLVNFSAGDAVHLREVERQRLVVRIGAIGAALVAALVLAVSVPRAAPHAGAGAAILLGTSAALAILVVGLLADRRVADGGHHAEGVREAFAVDLANYLPSLVRLPQPAAPAPKPLDLPTFQGLLPRTTLAIVITLTACVLGAVLMAQAVLRKSDRPEPRRTALRERPPEPFSAREAPAPTPRAQPAPPAIAAPAAGTSAGSAPAGDQVAIVDRCSCSRADSVLWRRPIPRLSVLVLSKKLRREGSRKELDIEIAAVNNGDSDITELSMMIQFFERDPPPSNRRYPTNPRAVYYQGPLGPGQAIKWGVEGRGTEFEIENPIPGDIGPGGDGAAPLNMLATLLDANHRPVRLHGAMMLAYLGDPRAREATLKLREALREDEAPYLDRILHALGTVRVCNLDVKGAGPVRSVQACVFNGSDESRKDLGLRVRALETAPTPAEPVAQPPIVLAESTWKIPGELAAQAGARATLKMRLDSGGDTALEPGASREPAAFEALADRVDLLR